ncbi:MAG TPA: ABC transporter permease subunit, partial [Planctomycetota bacterium]|nr:ABC transporter permease subunit [Planctomycetota bacterium]
MIGSALCLAVIGVWLAPAVKASPRTEPGLLVSLGLSLARMAVAFALSLAFAIAAGLLAATRPTIRRFLLPLLDVGQSVPIPALFPVVLVVFIQVAGSTFGSDRVGVELACIFLICTVQVWNLAFGVYEGITQIPDDLRFAADAFGLRPLSRFFRLYLPACVPKLVYNSIASWANGWYFLTLCEIVDSRHRVEGIGSFLDDALSGRAPAALFPVGLALVLGVVVAMELLLWRPLTTWSRKFRYETARGEVAESVVVLWWRRSEVARRIRGVARSLAGRTREAVRRLTRRLPRPVSAAPSALARGVGSVGSMLFVAAI